MSFPKIVIISGCCVFAILGGVAAYKKVILKRTLSQEIVQVPQAREAEPSVIPAPQPYNEKLYPMGYKLVPIYGDKEYEIDRVSQLFITGSHKLPIVQTVTYTSRVPWLKGRPAWIADYAAHFGTSRHFIARSLNGKTDYITQKVSIGDRFNVFRDDKHFNFYLAIDLSRRKLWFYYIDQDTNERVLLKTYPVGIGRLEERSPSGTLTPIGKYALGNKIAIYKPGTMGLYQDQPTEMIRVFGTRWIPFSKEIGECSAPAKGLGLHGAPWVMDPDSRQLKERRDAVGVYESDACIRLYREDIEELFSIIITKPTIVEIVTDIANAELPGIEVQDMKK